MKTRERPFPVVRCADEYFRIFGNPWDGTKMLKGLGLGIVLMFAVDAVFGLLEPVGLGWLVFVLLFGAGLISVGVHHFKPHPREGERTGPRVSRANFFRTLACPHCGKPVGSTYSEQWILHLHCVHCGGEARTDCMMIKGGPVKV